jgi:hypothetical protein
VKSVRFVDLKSSTVFSAAGVLTEIAKRFLTATASPPSGRGNKKALTGQIAKAKGQNEHLKCREILKQCQVKKIQLD